MPALKRPVISHKALPATLDLRTVVIYALASEVWEFPHWVDILSYVALLVYFLAIGVAIGQEDKVNPFDR